MPIPYPENESLSQYCARPFLIVGGHGVLVSKSITPAQLAMISGLAQVVQRVNASTPLRYLSEAEVATGCNVAAHRYRELAGRRR
jgi:hypothetical protein